MLFHKKSYKNILGAVGLGLLLVSCGADDDDSTVPVPPDQLEGYWGVQQYQAVDANETLIAVPGQVTTIGSSGDEDVYKDKPMVVKDDVQYVPILFLTKSGKYYMCVYNEALKPENGGASSAGNDITEMVLNQSGECVGGDCSSFKDLTNVSDQLELRLNNPNEAVWSFAGEHISSNPGDKVEIQIDMVRNDLSGDPLFKDCSKDVDLPLQE
jgi:hypothetical protein